jgi:hypothetical protein
MFVNNENAPLRRFGGIHIVTFFIALTIGFDNSVSSGSFVET